MSRRVKGILIPVSSGKTKLSDLVHGLDANKRDVVFIDIDASLLPVEGGSSIDLFPKAKELIQTKSKEYRKHSIVVLSSNEQLFKFLKIPSQRLSVFVPTTHFFLKMMFVRKLINPAVPGSKVAEPEVVEKLTGNNELKKKKSFSLGKELGSEQKNRNVTEENLRDLYDGEIEAISNSRDSLLKKKHIKYNSFVDLRQKVQKTLLKMKNVE